MFTSYTNHELLKRIAVDDIKAFEELYQRHASKMLVYALNILKKRDVCEDLVQNIFIDFWSKRKSNSIQNVEAYLFRAVKFQVFNYFRDHKFSNEDLTRLNIVDVSMNAAKKMEYDELESAIKDVVNQLPPRCKEIFELSRYDHKSNKEIAETLNVSIQAVKNQISKALITIRTNLHREELFFFFIVFFKHHF
ncbi:RNA polymerase sigma-70 factor [Gelidibacter maritimus]|uniref:RNA polymerase sigma-70 factor n=1 Tax=Gelidibacter maritimus TaxID=2761487 RepID=A0A7W2M5M0_9FLAO|nr:RNA polymerase sigma-70 factor [Gelidibacter maritimus]MBA6152901.1 RNA polymerase sigma-70 factor [Gelidibacter maritimus]